MQQIYIMNMLSLMLVVVEDVVISKMGFLVLKMVKNFQVVSDVESGKSVSIFLVKGGCKGGQFIFECCIFSC